MANEMNIEVRFPEDKISGVYANNMVVSHTKEEFIMDFMFLAQPSGTVGARVITSPGHMKRILSAVKENIARYEKTFGKIQEAPEPKAKIGFHP